ncbi:MAG: AAA family ATPase, partial [Solirubrobacterales bacterium]|nr:AAA family ATPase [Solirubrobacterales bacterium]
MLSELKIKNLLLIEEAELELDPGLNILTGETGAGKTLLATALGLLLGERSKSGLVRPGAPEALVEGVFTLPSELSEDLQALLPDDAHELILARRIWPDGRSRAVINGATATVGDLRTLGSAVLS